MCRTALSHGTDTQCEGEQAFRAIRVQREGEIRHRACDATEAKVMLFKVVEEV